MSCQAIEQPFSNNLESYEFLSLIGEGAFSTIHLAREKATNRTCAIKQISKRLIVLSGKISYALSEKEIMIRVRGHPHIVQLFATFQDLHSLYYVMEYCPNGDFQKYLSTFGVLREDQARFSCAELLLAIEYLHSQDIIHRDIKPENLLLDEKMHLKLCDFFTAKCLEHDSRAKSFVGTAEYLPPELFQKGSVGKPGDIWAFGCVLYKFLCGTLPWTRSNEYLTFQAITRSQVTFPDTLSASVKDLLSNILVFDEEKRFTIPQIKAHSFFEGIDWQKISTADPPLSPLNETTTDQIFESIDHINKEKDGDDSKEINFADFS